jgi:hypothetical protein
MTRMAQSAAGGRKPTAARWRRAGPLLVALVAAAALAAACSSGGGSHDAASPSPNATSARSLATQAIRFDSCIRAHGIPDFPDSAVYMNGGQLELHVPGYLKSEPQFLSALQACQKYLIGGAAPVKHVNLDEELAFARCMRSHGITDFPDPASDGVFGINLSSAATPQFEAAAHACQSTGVHWNSAP